MNKARALGATTLQIMCGSVAYLGFQKEGGKFLLVLTQRANYIYVFQFFLIVKTFFAKGGHGPTPPPPNYATGAVRV